MLRKRLAALTVGALILGGTAAAVPLIASGGVAGASAGTHKVGSFQNFGSNFEGKAKIKYTCSGTTGVYSLKITELNVVDASGHSHVDGDLTLTIFTGAQNMASITQNSTDGLWGTVTAGTIPPSECQSGLNVEIFDHATGGSGFDFFGVLS
jgi:hypothetical protein